MFTGPSAVYDFTDRGRAQSYSFQVDNNTRGIHSSTIPSDQSLPCKLPPLRKVLLFVEKVSEDKQVARTSIKKCLVESLVPQHHPMFRPWT